MRRPAARDPPYTVDPPSTWRRLPRRARGSGKKD